MNYQKQNNSNDKVNRSAQSGHYERLTEKRSDPRIGDKVGKGHVASSQPPLRKRNND